LAIDTFLSLFVGFICRLFYFQLVIHLGIAGRGFRGCDNGVAFFFTLHWAAQGHLSVLGNDFDVFCGGGEILVLTISRRMFRVSSRSALLPD